MQKKDKIATKCVTVLPLNICHNADTGNAGVRLALLVVRLALWGFLPIHKEAAEQQENYRFHQGKGLLLLSNLSLPVSISTSGGSPIGNRPTPC